MPPLVRKAIHHALDDTPHWGSNVSFGKVFFHLRNANDDKDQFARRKL